MTRWLTYSCWLILSVAAAVAAEPVNLYVSASGRDSWSGGLPAPNAVGTDGPFATVGRARDAIRAGRQTGAFRNQPVIVSLRGGRYELREPLRFTPDDSGTAAAPVTYRSYPGERAVLSGGRPIAGQWRQSPGKPYWEIAIPEAKDGKWLFHSLFVNGMSRERARYPNWNQKVLRGEGRAPGEDPRRALAYAAGDIDPAWTDLTNIDLVLLGSWTPTLHKIREVLPERRVVRFDSTYTRTVDAYERNYRYYVANVFEALDAPGEWYLNRQTGMLYYYPLPGEVMADAEVIAPVLKSRIVEFVGDIPAGRFVEHLRFESLDIRHVDGDLVRYNGTYRQGHMFLDAAVYAKGLRSSVFSDCELAQLGEYAMELADGCRDNRVERCHIWDIGAGALQIGVTELGPVLAARMAIGTVLEAEEAEIVPPMVVEDDAQAAKGQYVVLPTGQNAGEVRFSIDLEQAGKYRLFARVAAPSGNSDSFAVRINGGPLHTYDAGSGQGWFISKVASRETGYAQLKADLAAGRNTIVVAGRESGTRLDQLVLVPMRDADLGRAHRAEIEALNNVIDNNFIHRTGTIWHGCYGIVNRFASFTRITHNEITDTHYTAIGLDARDGAFDGERYSEGNEVAYNHLHHLGLGYHTDGAGVYQFGPLDTHIHHNLIHDTRAYPYICGLTGIYLDEQSRGALVENNLVHNVDWYAYFQNCGVGNVFRNNIGAFARDGLIGRGGLNETWKANYFDAYQNIYVAADTLAVRSKWPPGERPPVLRDNLYFTTARGAELTFGGKSLSEWQADGYDAGSVLADPGFVDAAKLDFRLKPAAPAVAAIGFQPFDAAIAKAGRYGDAAWLALAKRYPARTVTPEWTPDELLKLRLFRLDFENMPDGHEPGEFALVREGDATFAVTSEAACGGRRSLKCVDRKGLAKPYYPYVHVSLRSPLKSGTVTVVFDAMGAKSGAAPFYVECRTGGSPFETGPSLHFSREGKLIANGQEIVSVAPGVWCHVEMRLEVGPSAAGKYALLTRVDGNETTRTIEAPPLAELGWFGVVAGEDTDGVFYLDNLVFQAAQQ